MEIIIRGKNKYARSRGELEDNLRKEGKSTLSDEQHDKCKFIERKVKNKFGIKGCFLDLGQIDSVK